MAKPKKKLPKKIAGYKVPKAIRKNSAPILALLSHARVQALVGAAIAAGLAALTEARTAADADGTPRDEGDGKAESAGKQAKSLAREGAHRATDIAEALGRAVASAIGDHMPGPARKSAPTRH